MSCGFKTAVLVVAYFSAQLSDVWAYMHAAVWDKSGDFAQIGL